MKSAPSDRKRVVYLRGLSIDLCVPDVSYLPLMLKWSNDQDVWRYLSRRVPIYEGDGREWFENLHQRKDEAVFIVEKKDATPLGTVGLHAILDNKAELSIVLGERTQWGKEFGTEACMMLLYYAFWMRDLRKVHLSVNASNVRAIRCYEKCGFFKEGLRLEHEFWEGVYEDEQLMGVFRHTWEPLWKTFRSKLEAS